MFTSKMKIPQCLKFEAQLERLSHVVNWLISCFAVWIGWTFAWALGILYNFIDRTEEWSGIQLLAPLCLDKPMGKDELELEQNGIAPKPGPSKPKRETLNSNSTSIKSD